MKKLFTISVITIVGLFALMAWSFPENTPWEDKVSPVLLEKARQSSGKIDFMVMMKQEAEVSEAKQLTTKEEKAWFVYNKLQQTAVRSQSGIIALLEDKGAKYHSFYIVNSIQVIGDIELIQLLAERPEVSKIMDNPTMKLNQLPEENSASTRDPENIEWGIEMINADDVWAMGYTGQGVVVGGADTGYEWIHPAIQNQYRGWDGASADHSYNWHDAIHEISPLHMDSIIDPSNNPCGLNSIVPCDDHNHGTHTMGTMIGDDGGDNQIGVAPGARWVACRNMERGYGSPSTYIECFEWFLAPTDINNENADPTKAPHVINNSWSCPEMEGCIPDNWSFMETAVNNLKSSGVVVVVSAGNSGSQGCGSVNTPSAMFENSFTIGSTDSNDTISSFSSRGPVTIDNSLRMKPNVSAPGRGVRSCVRNGGYSSFSGTSMAGPHVVGLVALLISANPALAGNVEEIENIVEQTAVQKTSDEGCGDDTNMNIPNNQYGFGRVDALAAVNLALQSSGVTGISNETIIRAFPNPVDETVQFELQNIQGKAQLEIYNASGQLLLSDQFDVIGAIQFESVSMNGLAHGIYFYKITSGKSSFGGKLIKK
jgi:serine protease AprX